MKHELNKQNDANVSNRTCGDYRATILFANLTKHASMPTIIMQQIVKEREEKENTSHKCCSAKSQNDL